MNRVVVNCDLIHPVGDVIFNSLSTFDPNKHWPGTTWVRLKACGLFGVDENNPKYRNPGTYVGENDHKLTESELAKHGHSGNGNAFLVFGNTQPVKGIGEGGLWVQGIGTMETTGTVGANQPHNNVQRSYLGYYWLRTA